MTQFSLQFLGTGNAWSKPPVNYNTNAIVRACGHAWLLDCGLLCPLALHDRNIPIHDIDGAFITHLHGDHALGLEEFFFQSFFACQKRQNLWLPHAFSRKHSPIEGSDLWDNCLRGSMETLIYQDGKPRITTLHDYADIHIVIPQQPFDIFGLPCEIFPVIHTPQKPAFGIILDNRVAFTSDCTFSQKRIETLLDRNVSLIFHEVYFSAPYPHAVHTSIDEIAELPEDIRKLIVLMHYADDTTKDAFASARKLGFQIATPGMTFDF